MYKIYADDTLIYDSTIENYKIGKGLVTLEVNKSGSFVFSVYPEHFYYNDFVKLRTVITVYRSDKIKFRGRILSDTVDYWNMKTLTCEGELGFLQDSVIRPFVFKGTLSAFFQQIINEHNSQVDEFKKFDIGNITLATDREVSYSSTDYKSSFDILSEMLVNGDIGGYIHITHGDYDTEKKPTIHYLADFAKIASQVVEFGSNLKNFIKTTKAENIATALIPLGNVVDDGDADTADTRLTIKSVNNDVDYIYDEAAVSLYGWIYKSVVWDYISTPSTLKREAEAYLDNLINQSITIELNAVDLHLLNRSIEAFNVCEYVRAVSAPHNFDLTLLCSRQTLNLLKPDNDTLVLGYTVATMLDVNNALTADARREQEAIRDKADLAISMSNFAASNSEKVTALFIASLGGANSDLLSGDTIVEGEYAGDGATSQEIKLDITPDIVIAARTYTNISQKKIIDEFHLYNYKELIQSGTTMIERYRYEYHFKYKGNGDRKRHENYLYYQGDYSAGNGQYTEIPSTASAGLYGINSQTYTGQHYTMLMVNMIQSFLDGWEDPFEETGGTDLPTSMMSSANGLIRLTENGFIARGEMNEISVGETKGQSYRQHDSITDAAGGVWIRDNIGAQVYYGISTFYDRTEDSKKYNYAAIGTAKSEV